eukprot:CAMPEP_0118962678 /NCGR_PEP_ID=MMETSP1173-20130426/923_1 /TAXON_ID=1034831 /ORGANISM="Rhizochromulina marina cf, Strain CCMP1243" /LENGTH=109 /DNA_ID=CAMNT_0006910967 /DNA_START=200 /DNA_END=529 /DNA_ORIENTATION=+
MALRASSGALRSMAMRPMTVAKRSFVRRTAPQKLDHHAFVVLTSVIGYIQATSANAGKNWVRRLCDREPVVAFSMLLGGVALLLPITVVPLRRSMGMDVSQYDGSSTSH